MIFKTITDDIGNTKLSINSGIKEVFSGSLFKKQSILSEDDIRILQAYNSEIARGVNPMTAYYRTMQNASDAATNMARSAEEMSHTTHDATVNLNQIPQVSKASQIALRGLSIALNTVKAIGITLAIQALISKFSELIHAQEEARKEAVELANSYKDQRTSLESQIAKYQELQDSLSKGNLSADEERSIKEQLLEVQNSLVESYGNEAANLDLVNGKYETQIGLLSELSKEKANDYVTENRDQFKRAESELKMIRSYNLGAVTSWSDSVPQTEDQKKLLDFIKSYSDLLELTTSDVAGG